MLRAELEGAFTAAPSQPIMRLAIDCTTSMRSERMAVATAGLPTRVRVFAGVCVWSRPVLASREPQFMQNLGSLRLQLVLLARQAAAGFERSDDHQKAEGGRQVKGVTACHAQHHKHNYHDLSKPRSHDKLLVRWPTGRHDASAGHHASAGRHAPTSK